METKLLQETEYTIQWVVVDPGQSQSFTNPGYDPEIEIQEIFIDGVQSTSEQFKVLMAKYEQEWVQDILAQKAVA